MARLRLAAGVGLDRRAVRRRPGRRSARSATRRRSMPAAATIELHRTETANYMSNLESGAPLAVGGAAPDRCRAALSRCSPLRRTRRRARLHRKPATISSKPCRCRSDRRASQASSPSTTSSGRSSSVSATAPDSCRPQGRDGRAGDERAEDFRRALVAAEARDEPAGTKDKTPADAPGPKPGASRRRRGRGARRLPPATLRSLPSIRPACRR